MLGSEVIKQIQNLIDEYGDLPIEISLNGSDQEEVKEICYGGYGKFSNKREKYMPEFGSPVLDIDCIYKIIGASMDMKNQKY